MAESVEPDWLLSGTTILYYAGGRFVTSQLRGHGASRDPFETVDFLQSSH